MAFKLTDEQQLAVDASVSENLISAAAGSGKTKVLSERITKRLRSGDTSIDRLLIVTFTRAAASQMRDRIYTALEQEYKVRKTKRLKKQLALIASADICTIDAFCIDLVRKNFFRANVPPDFTIADENEMAILKEEIVLEVIEEMYEEGNENFLLLSKSIGKGKNDNALKDMILKIHNYSMAFEDPEGWLDYAHENHIKGSLGSNMLFEYVREELLEELNDFKDMLLLAREDAYNAGIEAYGQVFEGEVLFIEKLFEEGNLENVLDNFAFGSFSGKKVDSSLAYEKDYLQMVHNDAKKVFDKIKDLNEIYKSERGVSEAKIGALTECVKRFGRKYMEEKLARKEMEFSDCEYFAYKILNESEEAVEELRDKYEEIYIDEYQDTNPLQDALFTLVSRKARGEANLFIVGDVKQSIYRFRHSDPTLFAQKAKVFGKTEGSRKMILSKNFRSREAVLDSINCVFDNIMRENTAQVEYDEEHRLKFGGKFVEYNKNKSEIYVLTGNYEKEDEDEELAREQKETLVAAKKIKDMMESGFMVMDKGKMRPMKYSDVAVLSRTIKGKADMITGIFNLMDIPAFCDAGNSFFDSLEIRTLIALLQAVDNPLCDIPLAALMRSPVFGFGENELLEICVNNRNVPFYENVKTKSEEESSLGQKCKEVIGKLETWREMSQIVPVKKFVWDILSESGFYVFARTLPGGETRCENLKFFVSLAANFESRGYKGLYNFIRYVEKSMEAGQSVSIEGNSSSDGVLVTSIHKSKGLEFPIVIVIGCGAQFNDKDATDTFILNPKGGIAIAETDATRRIKYKTAEYMGISLMIKREAHAEQMRLLYVAMTRAKEKLIMIGTQKNLDSKIDQWQMYRDGKRLSDYKIRNMTNYLEYIMSSLCEKYWDIHYVKELPELSVREGESDLKVKEGKIIKEVWDRLEYVYPFEGIREIPSKMSVSEIKKMSMENEEGVQLFEGNKGKRIPSFMKKETKLTANLRGTAFHTVMEHIDLNEKNVEEALEKLCEKGFITSLEKNSVEKEKIEKFLASPLADMMRNAKKVWKEEPFTISVEANDVFLNGAEEKICVQGTIDCLVEGNNGELILIDYKTDYYTDPCDIGKRYKKQLELYELAVFKKFLKKCDKKYLYLFHNDDIIEV